MQWFVVGLGIPILGVALLKGLLNDTPQRSVAHETVVTASDDSLPLLDPIEALDAAAVDVGPEPAVEPEPAFDQLVLTVGRGDTMERLFRNNNLDIGSLMNVAQLDAAKKMFRRIKPGDEFRITHDDGQLVSLYSELDLHNALHVERQEDGYMAQVIERPIEYRTRRAHGVIDTSLFESGAAAGLSDKLIMNVAGIFAWDVDFVLDIRSGDNYYVVYEELWENGRYLTDGEIVAAEFNNNGRQIQAIRFKDDEQRTDYFTPAGNSVRKAFIRAPVDFTRISSNFNPNRRHPILNKIRAHRGVDYAAPRGTPIKASGDGKVIFRGTKSGYGKVVILQHGGNITTLYAHMSNFAAGAPLGSRVKQGQTIGFVGKTGLATANHLHYEYRINGVHRNPRTVPLPDAEPIAEQYREQFLASAAPIIADLEAFKKTKLASIALSAP